MKKNSQWCQWCHVLCAFWLPKISFGDPVALEPVLVPNKIRGRAVVPPAAIAKVRAFFGTKALEDLATAMFPPDSREHLGCSDGHVCELCHTVWGLTSKCQARGCAQRFHPTCAREAGFFMEMEANPLHDADAGASGGGSSTGTNIETSPLVKNLYCKTHTWNLRPKWRTKFACDPNQEQAFQLRKVGRARGRGKRACFCLCLRSLVVRTPRRLCQLCVFNTCASLDSLSWSPCGGLTLRCSSPTTAS
jgi:hypothetical protein